MRAIFLAGTFLASVLAAPAAAEIRVLSIGVDDYAAPRVKDLKGAVNDARDIQESLKKIGVTDLVALYNADATRVKLEKAITDLIGRTKKDDIVIISFAGHGVQEKEAVPGNEDDGRDEMFVLHAFDPPDQRNAAKNQQAKNTPAFRDRIRDDEMNVWIGQIEKKGAKTIFIADSCHSGTMTRGGENLSTRLGPTYDVTAEMNEGMPLPLNGPEIKHKNLTFFSGGQDSEEIPEILVKDVKRGALSYAFSRAVGDGLADSNGDGALTRRELYKYMRQTTRELSGSQQTPNFEPSATERQDEIVLRLRPDDDPKPDDEVDPPPPTGAVRLRVSGRANVAEILKSLIDEKVVAIVRQGDADLVWDVDRKRVMFGNDVVAYDIDANGEALRNVVERTWTIKRLLELPRKPSGTETRVEPRRGSAAQSPKGDSLHKEGSEIDFVVEGPKGRHLMLTNLTSDGMVQWLNLDRGQQVLGDRPYRAGLKVEKPFGGDMVVAFVSKEADEGLSKKLRALSGIAGSAKDLYDIAKQVDQEKVEILLQGIYTAPR